MAQIGIRLADGKFYPILDEGTLAKKRLVVTTVKDDQPSVQIDVYRSDDGVTTGAYVGSLVVDNIPSGPGGSPDIRLDLGLDGTGKLSALAIEESSGEHQTLEVSMSALDEEAKYDIPDFDLQDDDGFDLSTDSLPEPPRKEESFDLPDLEEDETGDELEDDTAGPEMTSFAAPAAEERKKGLSPLVIGLLALLGVAIVLALAFLLYNLTGAGKEAKPAAAVTQPAPEPVRQPEPQPVPPPPPASEAPSVAATPATQPVAEVQPKPETPAPAAKPAEKPATATKAPVRKPGTWYKIRWGDTLWDLSIAYYRTPWLYGTIARANKIRNPDLIISGHWIYIPRR